MSDASQQSGRGPTQQQMEIGVAVLTAVFGLVIMYGSYLVGIDWGVEGPRSGFFPFYVGLVIVVCAAAILVQNVIMKPEGLFADWSQLRSVMYVVIPTAIYVVAMPYFGIYVTSALLIGGFMKTLGKYSWSLTAAVSLGVPVAVFLMFEKWFLVPLPKCAFDFCQSWGF